MLLLGFGAALRRSELVALTLADVTAMPGRGVQLRIRRSKTDQQGRGDLVAVAANPVDPGFCPAVALQDWLRHRERATDVATIGSPSGADERALFCAVSKGGKVMGTALSDNPVPTTLPPLLTAQNNGRSSAPLGLPTMAMSVARSR